MTDKPKKTREELAIGVLGKNGKRTGGYVNMYRNMRQWQEWLTSGEKSEDDLIEAAFAKADAEIARRDAAPGEEPQTNYQEDMEYRAEQEARYRELYEWNDANDEAALQQLLDLEIRSRAVNRKFAAAHMNVKDEVALLGELRKITMDFASLQKSLGIDRKTREDQSRTADPMAELRTQIKLGADYVRKLRDEWVEVAPTVVTREELVARAQHHSGLPQDWIEALLQAYERVRAVGGDSTATVVA